MRLILLLLPFLASACIDGSRDGSTADTATTSETSDATDVADTRSEVDTGGVTCGKCVQVWHTEQFNSPQGSYVCIVDNQTGARCCPEIGDVGCCAGDAPSCPTARAGYEWGECVDVREAFGRVFCKDDDAYVKTGRVSERGALCTTEETGCEGDVLPNEP